MGFKVGGGGGISTETLYDTSVTMDGTEQALIDEDTSNLEVTGRIGLDNMESGDTIILRTYINGVKNAVSTYTDALLQSQVIITPVVFGDGEVWKITLEQTATGVGGYKSVSYKIVSRG